MADSVAVTVLVCVRLTGPVFASDQIGHANAPLIMRACMADGFLLQPSNSAVPTDKCIAAKAGVLPSVNGQPTPGTRHVYGTSV